MCEVTALLHFAGHCEGLGNRPVVVEPTYHVYKVLRTAEFLYGFPQSFAIHRVECFLQVHESSVEVGARLLALLLQLSRGEDHVGGAAMAMKTTLVF
ncbi:unnamed protein product [Dibothriocephalus latus]|uniref:Uncharacterized protein n=1 Tax=Dibothriocephalus latus TaxID=60516 RepID=A0A3P7PXU9_DIBLA|nr:unnamed protein product [Dibothriocephalus latus]